MGTWRTGAAAASLALTALLLLTACASGPAGSSAPAAIHPSGSTSAPAASSVAAAAGTVPRPAHIVVVVLENHAYSQVIGSPEAPFLNHLARTGALFTRSFAITHPSEPNYLALFSGSTQGVTSDACPVEFTAPNLASGLIAAGQTFAGYAEGLPAPGSTACGAGEYARKHVPWADFRNVPAAISLPFSRFPADFNQLPTVSFVIPNLCHDMHDCSVGTGDSWLRAHLSGYADWAMTHDSLLIVTWDEDDGSQANQIATIFAGQLVKPGTYQQKITHYSVLATIEAAYGLPRDGSAAAAQPIGYIWRSSA
jgi:phosphatidylinositol-3-phosphatase